MGGGVALLSVHTVDAVSATYGFPPRKPDEVMAPAAALARAGSCTT